MKICTYAYLDPTRSEVVKVAIMTQGDRHWVFNKFTEKDVKDGHHLNEQYVRESEVYDISEARKIFTFQKVEPR